MVMDSSGITKDLKKLFKDTKKSIIENLKPTDMFPLETNIKLKNKKQYKTLENPNGPYMYEVSINGKVVEMTVAEYKELKYQEKLILNRKTNSGLKGKQIRELTDKVLDEKSDVLRASRFRRNFLKRSGLDSSGMLARMKEIANNPNKLQQYDEIKSQLTELGSLLKDMSAPEFENIYQQNKELFKDLSAYYKAARSDPLAIFDKGSEFTARYSYKNEETGERIERDVVLKDIIDRLKIARGI